MCTKGDTALLQATSRLFREKPRGAESKFKTKPETSEQARMKYYRNSEAAKDTCSQDTDEGTLFRAGRVETGLEAQSRRRQKRNLSHALINQAVQNVKKLCASSSAFTLNSSDAHRQGEDLSHSSTFLPGDGETDTD